ncbi:MAG TPA: class II aldolase/adducin family protein [Spirochaetota bacterium]|nr:class II aldolase/adducin family protein [Spirochaetota bacterium]HPD77511.1 class II aldolase/adducin family protein [Spirochaetota bacterium]HRS63592.1 class II aldolase/adducin family protein [Spirochaetota bacterium]HRU64403.1 class II aldolase/adducin family protein [Spirochaetota bacterium]
MAGVKEKYLQKLISQRLCNSTDPLVGFLDADLQWNRESDKTEILSQVVNSLGVSAIIYSIPREPYKSMIKYLASYEEKDFLKPEDTETRTFLHDIPIAQNLNVGELTQKLKKRKGLVLKDGSVITQGAIGVEQAFVTFSSICFSLFVKFMCDFYYHRKNLMKMEGEVEEIAKKAIKCYEDHLLPFDKMPQSPYPFEKEDDAIAAIIEAGSLTVESGLVDSFFGNISCLFENTIYISQTGSSLDELEGYIDPCPIDNSKTNAITASSEFSTHRAIYLKKKFNAILHGHPKFSVIYSMLCDKINCPNRGKCHISCSDRRFMKDVPIVTGEVGRGKNTLLQTVPEYISGRGVIVFGHGVFTAGGSGFYEIFRNLLEIEKEALWAYKDLVF